MTAIVYVKLSIELGPVSLDGGNYMRTLMRVGQFIGSGVSRSFWIARPDRRLFKRYQAIVAYKLFYKKLLFTSKAFMTDILF